MATIPVVSRGIGRKPPSDIWTKDNRAFVSLNKGFEATIDLDDIGLIAGYRWVALINGRTGHAYAVRYEKGKCILMHRVLLAAPPFLWVDHKDGDGLNNTRQNIRLATPSQNMANKVVERRNRLGVKGVSPSQNGRRFKAVVAPNGKKIFLGSFATAEEAAAAYQGAARVIWKGFAHK